MAEKHCAGQDPQDTIARLERENRRLRRLLQAEQLIRERHRRLAAAKTGVDSLLIAERISQDKYMRLLLENSPDIILLLDADGRFVYCTDSFLRITGIDGMERIVGLHYGDVFTKYISESWRTRADELLRRAAARKVPVETQEVWDVEGRGNPRHYQLHLAPMIGADGAVEGSVALMHDITELLRARRQAEQASRAKGDFLATMSHEMRTPLTAIIGMTGIARQADNMERIRDALEKIDTASVHLLGVINDILDMSKIESGRFELTQEPFSFERMLLNVSNVMAFRIEEKRQRYAVRIHTDVPAVLIADEQRLAQVITNLLSNAVKFTPEGGDITLTARKLSEEDGWCAMEIAVTDSGIGITDAQRERLFQSFMQGDSGISRQFGGTGLGLAISRGIVEQMGGRIWVESETGRGARFVFTIHTRIDVEQPPTLNPDAVDWPRVRVLVLDPSEDVWAYFQRIAQKLGFACDQAAGLPDGEMPQDAERYDVVFADMESPAGANTPMEAQLARLGAARRRHGARAVIAIASTTRWNTMEQQARAAGVDGHLPKPLFASMISDCVAEHIGVHVPHRAEAVPDMDATGRYAGKRVLLAEDIQINREIVTMLLENTGLAFDYAENGEEALVLFGADPERYDLVLVDVQMPVMDGYEATRRIRALGSPRARAVPIVAMTANVFAEDIARCLAAGMNDHIGKPINVQALHRKLTHYLCGEGALDRAGAPGHGNMTLRPYRAEDDPQLSQLFYEAVHTAAAGDYTPAQLDAWAPDDVGMPRWCARLAESYAVVVERGGAIAGFGSLLPDGCLDMLYVHPDHQRCGVATRIADALEAEARALGHGTVTTHASITALPFFVRRGYLRVRENVVQRRGETLTNYEMRRSWRDAGA